MVADRVSLSKIRYRSNNLQVHGRVPWEREEAKALE